MVVAGQVQKVIVEAVKPLPEGLEDWSLTGGPTPKDAFIFHIFKDLRLETALELTDKPGRASVTLIGARDVPPEFTMTIVCASEQIVPKDQSSVGFDQVYYQDKPLDEQVKLCRGLYRRLITVQTRTFDVYGIVRQVSVRDDTENDNVVYVDLEIRTMASPEDEALLGPRLGRIEVPVGIDPASEDAVITGSGPHTCVRIAPKVFMSSFRKDLSDIGRNIGNFGSKVGKFFDLTKRADDFGRGFERIKSDITGGVTPEENEAGFIELDAVVIAAGFQKPDGSADRNAFFASFFDYAVTRGAVENNRGTVTQTVKVEGGKALLRLFDGTMEIDGATLPTDTFVALNTRSKLRIFKFDANPNDTDPGVEGEGWAGDLLIEYSRSRGFALTVYGVCAR